VAVRIKTSFPTITPAPSSHKLPAATPEVFTASEKDETNMTRYLTTHMKALPPTVIPIDRVLRRCPVDGCSPTPDYPRVARAYGMVFFGTGPSPPSPESWVVAFLPGVDEYLTKMS
jgi:hypothetical protein